jgi:uncharacterized repeat protein (TIGR01451 family)
MSRQRTRSTGTDKRSFARATQTAGLILGMSVWALLTSVVHGQIPPAAPAPTRGLAAQPAPAAPVVVESTPAPGTAVVGAGAGAAVPAPASGLDPNVQIVRFQGPPGLVVEVLAPPPEAVPIGDGGGIVTVGLKRGVGYRLRLSQIPFRPDVELYPVIEIVGHLHRPEGIDPGKYPIRIVFNQDDLDDTVDQKRLVTKVIYLEDPDQAIPFRVSKEQVSVLTLNPTEPPLRIASALGRPVAIVRMGVRKPTVEEIQAGAAGDMGLDYAASIGTGPCPFLTQAGTRCSLPCGPPCTPAPRPARPALPRDEYLCDGGDRGAPAGAGGGNAHVGGIDPRDTVVGFDIGITGISRPRVLPTNVVCVYAPRFAEVRVATGPNQQVDIQSIKTEKWRSKLSQTSGEAVAKKMVQNQSPELARARLRATAYKGRVQVGEDSNNRAAIAFQAPTLAAINLQQQTPELSRNRQKPIQINERLRLDGIKTAEAPVVTALTQGTSERVKVWGPHDMTGVEIPPDRPGLAVIKRVSAVEAEPGDTLTYVIFYRNMGNTPIRSVSIVDSLLPRLEYVKGTSRGPAGTGFSTAMNRVGSTELHWELPGILAPGASGYVSFQAIVR